MAKKATKTKTKKKVRSAAERSAAAKASWQLRRLRSAKQPTPATPPIEEYMWNTTAATPEVTLEPPITLSVTREGDGIYLTIANNGALSRTRVRPETLRVLALDALQMVG